MLYDTQWDIPNIAIQVGWRIAILIDEYRKERDCKCINILVVHCTDSKPSLSVVSRVYIIQNTTYRQESWTFAFKNT
jgi:hypothetical protein